MRDTAKTLEEKVQNLCQEQAERTARENVKGPKRINQIGNEVSFYIPPSEEETKQMGRKPKHLLSYRGPAVITERILSTTYELKYNGRTYYRCFSELGPYKSPRLPLELPMTQD